MPTKKAAKSNSKAKPLVGFIGQGFVGKAYADDFENRGFSIVRYSLETPYIQNKSKIKDCDVVFIAVPTPTTSEGFDDHIIRDAVKLLGKGKTAVIKSTIVPGTTLSIQNENPDIYVFHSPEFLREVTASKDAAEPERNIIGVPKDSKEHAAKAKDVMAILPKAPFELITGAKEAELIKYAGNCFFYFKLIFANIFHDLAEKENIDWSTVKNAVAADPRIGASHLEPVHKSGRGAGGHCFIKDFAAFSELYEKMVGDTYGVEVLESLRDKNVDLLMKSKKDLDLLTGVYGSDFLKRFKNN
ncbi:MAG: hypothetical protein V4467_01700 [Patescibacteria group bacterium]